MPNLLRIVNSKGETASYRGRLLMFDLNKPGLTPGMNERERAETILYFLNRECEGGPFRIEEFEMPPE